MILLELSVKGDAGVPEQAGGKSGEAKMAVMTPGAAKTAEGLQRSRLLFNNI